MSVSLAIFRESSSSTVFVLKVVWMGLLRTANRYWFKMSQCSLEWAMGFAAVGVLLNLAAWSLGLGSVEFDGRVAGEMLDNYPDVLPKQVGFFYAPNWAIASVVVVPACILLLFSARASIEPIFDQLIDRGMLREIDGSRFDKDRFLVEWEKASSKWMIAPLATLLVVFVVTIPMDFRPVVGLWLWDPAEAAKIMADSSPAVSIDHSVYEFDWSIAALYTHPAESPISNLAFSLAAYLIVAVAGSGLILAVFFWLPAVPSFLRQTNLRRHGWEIVPDLGSQERRLGFEVFEHFYRYIIWGAIFTSILALSMHIQNVFLRSPTFQNIGQMTFTNALEIVKQHGTDFGAIVSSLFSTADGVAGPTGGEINLQFGISFIGILLLVGIVMTVLLTWLSVTPKVGAESLRQGGKLLAIHKKALAEMQAWPVPDVPRHFLLLWIILVIFSIYMVNLVVLLLLVVSILFISSSISQALKVRADTRAARQEEYEDDDDAT